VARTAVVAIFQHLLFLLGLAAAALSLPEAAFAAESREAILAIGAVGMWRYGWGATHLARSVWFRKVRFRARRRQADLAAARGEIGHAYFLLTSYRIDAPTTAAVYRGAFAAAARAPAGATVVASLVELGDVRLIRRLAQVAYGDEPPFRLQFVRIPGTGKRDALAHGLAAIAAFAPGPDDTVSVIDGDSIVPPDLVERCAPFFALDPRLGALTTDETCTVEGAAIFRQWYSLRFAQRQILMCSHGLARRVLTLTGRMSMFRAPLACDPGFIAHIRNDRIGHWRLGEIRMLTGDDKSSWFWLLKHGWRMDYVPDVAVETIEQPPTPRFLESARLLMTRWFGNMLRTNGRALALGPWRIGFFTWMAVLDQRLSMWTCLSGLVLAILGAVFVSAWTLVFYALWVAASRYVVTLSLMTARRSVSLAYVPLLYFNQVFGSLIKILVFFRLDRQKWTRQDTALKPAAGRWQARYRTASSHLMTASALGVYVAIVAMLGGLFDREPAWQASATVADMEAGR
jgi:mannuronan synthase